MPTTVPPDDGTLRRFLLGTLAPEEAAPVERWVGESPAAAETLHGIHATDDVTDALAPDIVRTRSDAEEASAMHTVAQFGTPDAAGDPVPEYSAEVGGYRVVGKLGEGGMGVVFEAEDAKLGRRVAIKVMSSKHAANSGSRNRFLREARAAAAIEHENVVPLYVVGEHDGLPFIVMPLLRGESLWERLERDKVLSLGEVVRLGREVAAGLAAAHDKGLIHRDIKPANIWLDADTGRARILDFGLAKAGAVTDADDSPNLTVAGLILGTPAYMSPEQAAGGTLDARSDLFSLGVVLYHAATGRRPFPGSNTTAILYALASHIPEPAHAVNPDCPPALSRLLAGLLAKQPDQRPPSARSVGNLLRAIDDRGESTATDLISPSVPPLANRTPAGSDTAVSNPSPVSPARKKPRRRVTIAAGFLALLAVAVAGVIVIKITNKDGTVTQLTVPDGSKVEVTTGGKTVAVVAPGKVASPRPVIAIPKGEKAGEERTFEVAPGVGMVFCWVPAGEAQLGSPKAEREAALLAKADAYGLSLETEGKRGKFNTTGFWLGKYEVTQAEWRAVMGTNPSHFDGQKVNKAKGLDTSRFPVEQVTWEDCQKFLAAANGAGNAGTFALPEEDEWEYACRGGRGNGRAFYWGDKLDATQANSDVDDGPSKMPLVRTCSVDETNGGKYEVHPWGLAHIHGNVREWCNTEDSRGWRAIRGGSWVEPWSDCRAACRPFAPTKAENHAGGFRVCIRPVK